MVLIVVYIYLQNVVVSVFYLDKGKIVVPDDVGTKTVV